MLANLEHLGVKCVNAYSLAIFKDPMTFFTSLTVVVPTLIFRSLKAGRCVTVLKGQGRFRTILFCLTHLTLTLTLTLRLLTVCGKYAPLTIHGSRLSDSRKVFGLSCEAHQYACQRLLTVSSASYSLISEGPLTRLAFFLTILFIASYIFFQIQTSRYFHTLFKRLMEKMIHLVPIQGI